MPDVFTKAKRSAVMARIRSRGNRDTELRMIELFRAGGITGWRRQQRVFGKPDFVFPKQRVAVFVAMDVFGIDTQAASPVTRPSRE